MRGPIFTDGETEVPESQSLTQHLSFSPGLDYSHQLCDLVGQGMPTLRALVYL